MADINYKNDKGINKLLGKAFGFCTGYGYKPMKAIPASLILIIFSALMYSIIDLFNLHPFVIDLSNLPSNLYCFFNNFLYSIAAFAGQSGAIMEQGAIFWISTFEYVLGIIIFAMFVNALYVRYKE